MSAMTTMRSGQQGQRPDRRNDRAPGWFGLGLIALGAGLASNALLGPLVTGVVSYPISESVLNETLGLEVVSLALVAPLCLLAGVLALRNHRAGRLLAFAPAAYSLYLFAQYVLGPQYAAYPAALPLHLGIFILAGAILVQAWSLARPEGLPTLTARSERRWGWVLLGMGGFVLSRYIPALAGIGSNEPIPGEYGPDATFYWSMLLMDLGIIVPATIATGVALLRGRGWARTGLYAIVGWFALLPISVASMGITKLVNDDPRGDAGTSIMFVVAAAIFAAVAVKLYRPLFLAADPSSQRSPGFGDVRTDNITGDDAPVAAESWAQMLVAIRKG